MIASMSPHAELEPMTHAPDRITARANQRLAWAGAIIGFSLGGFFDGILLH